MIGHYPKPPASPRGTYPGSGIHRGGQVGRKTALHMGLPSAVKGGFNTQGSARRVTKFVQKPLAAAAHPWHAAPRPLANAHGPVPLGAKTPPVAAPVLGGLNTHDSTYGQAAALANYNYDNAGFDITPLRAQLEANKPLYELGKYDTDKWNSRDFYDTNAALSNRGIVGTSNTVTQDVDRKNLYDRKLQDLSEQYGDAAAKRIMGQIDSLEAQRLQGRTFDMQGAEQDAYQRALQNLADNPPDAPVVAAAKAAAVAVKPGGVAKPKPKPAKKSLSKAAAVSAWNKPKVTHAPPKPKPTTKPVPVSGKKAR